MQLYCWGDIGLEPDGLLAQFYGSANDELCARAFQQVGLGIDRPARVSPDVLTRLKQLWDYRLEESRRSPSQHVGELAEFGWWFASGKFDDTWAIEQLAMVLRTGGKINPGHKVAGRLVSLCQQMPYGVLECLNLMIANDRMEWSARLCFPEIETVLKQTLGSSDVKVAGAANDLRNRMLSWGFHQFAGL